MRSGSSLRTTGVGVLKIVGIFTFSVLLLGALIFAPARRLDWPAGWLCLAVMVIGFSAVTAHVAKRTPSLIRRRARIGTGTPRWDLILVGILQLLFSAILVVGGLDGGRQRWSPLPLWLQAIGFVLMIAALVLIGWTMGENPHFESTVRIQSDRHHRVIATGPYRLVRHPGYAAAIVLLHGMALLLGSGWALVPALLATVGLVVRTALEDRFLKENLDGYELFTHRTQFRLVPGIW